MKIKRIRLRGYVIPAICIILVGAIFYSSYKVWELVEDEKNNVIPTHYVNKSSSDIILPTISESIEIIKPYTDESVEKTINYYDKDSNENDQQSALIYYENIYMQNTGIMYTSSNQFDVVSVLDGTVKNVKEDPIMGKIIEIEHSQNTTTIYQSLSETNVSAGQKINQGEIIGKAGNNQIVENNKYALHFEVYRNGELINPEDFYKLSYEEIVNE